MDRNTIIGFVLIGALLIAFSYFNQPTKEQRAHREHIRDSMAHVMYLRDSIRHVAPLNSSASNTAPSAHDSSSRVAQTDTVREQNIAAENDVMAVTFSSKGAMVKSVQLKQYKTWNKKPLVLFNPQNRTAGFQILTPSGEINTAQLNFSPQVTNNKVSGNEKATFVFTAPIGDGRSVQQSYTLTGNSHLIESNFKIIGNAQNIQKIVYYDRTYLNNVEQVKKNEINNASIYFKYANDNDVEHISEGKIGDENIPTPVDWVAFKQQYFNASLLSKGMFESGKINVTADTLQGTLNKFETSLVVNYDPTKPVDFTYNYYYGPNSYRDLKKLDIGLEKIIPLGWGIFGWFAKPVNKWFIIPLFDFFSGFIRNYGIIILLMTVLIRVILYPLTYKSLASAAKMRVLKPEIDELKERFKDDQARFGQEQMKLFQRAGVNPLGGCIPTLLQLPILVAMYSFFPVSIELRQQPFLWAKDLSTYDSVLNFGFTIPFFGDHLSMFTLLMTVTSILMAVYNNQLTGATGQTKWMPYIFPIMLFGIFNNLSAALTYYYFLSNVISFAMQWGIQKFALDEAAIHREIQENKKKTPKKSGFMQRLEDMQRQQRQMSQQRKR